MRQNDPMSIDLTAPGTTCIARASSEGDGRDRWSTLTVWHLPDGRYLAQSEGLSDRQGERTKTRRLASATLGRALKLFDDSDLGIAVTETAQEWAEQHELAQDAALTKITDQMALEHLYGKEPTGRKGYSGLVAKDFGVGESTVRMAIANGTPIKVPLTAVIPYLDPRLLARVREMSRG